MLALIGTALQIFGKVGANVQQGMAELQNASFYKEQADFAQFTKQRELSLISRNYAQQYSQRQSAYAGGGVDSSGSAEAVLGIVTARHFEEALAISTKYNLESKLARMRGTQSSDVAGTLNSTGYNLTQGATTALTAYNEYNKGGSSSVYTSYQGSGPMSPSASSGYSFLTSASSYLTGSSGGY
jgi:hypothetical protein